MIFASQHWSSCCDMVCTAFVNEHPNRPLHCAWGQYDRPQEVCDQETRRRRTPDIMPRPSGASCADPRVHSFHSTADRTPACSTKAGQTGTFPGRKLAVSRDRTVVYAAYRKIPCQTALENERKLWNCWKMLAEAQIGLRAPGPRHGPMPWSLLKALNSVVLVWGVFGSPLLIP